MNPAPDILNKINEQVQDKAGRDLLIKMVKGVSTMNLNVGSDQLIRSMLMLSNFEPKHFQQIIDTKFNDDPRDIIMEAHAKFEDMNYGIKPFSFT